MKTPRLEIDLKKIEHNATVLVNLLADRGISVTGVTKAVSGSIGIADALNKAGVATLGDSRLENIDCLRKGPTSSAITLIRSPLMSQIEQTVLLSDISFNTELDIISQLSKAAKKADRIHGVVLMIELGDLREGIMPDDIEAILRRTLRFPNISFRGIGTNLACRSGVAPSTENMGLLSRIADSLEATFGLGIGLVSGGNSANLSWVLSGSETGRINNLRLGESILLGREPLHGQPINGLHLDAFSLIGEVIESKVKPSQPAGETFLTPFEIAVPIFKDTINQNIIALGQQDTDPKGLSTQADLDIISASSDHLIISDNLGDLEVGSEVSFQVNYSALIRAMNSPFVEKVMNTLAAV